MPSEVTAFAPGRVNLIGEHTDYNHGLALPFAIEQGVTVHAARLPGRRVEALARELGASDSFELDHPAPVPGWSAFVRGAVGELQAAGVAVPGARLEISGTVPPGAGLSSSAALEVALTMALIELAGGQELDRTELARLCSRVENQWVGAHSGLLDQLASLYGQAGHVLRIDFRSLDIDAIPIDLGDHKLVTLDSGERHATAVSGYNQRRAECARACELLDVASLREATPEMARQLPSPLDRRALHVIGSSQRVDQAVEALAARDYRRLGELLEESHASLRDLYEVSTGAVEETAARLRAAGALGARIHGGGFGGHVLGLLPPHIRLPEGAREVRPGPGSRVLEPD